MFIKRVIVGLLDSNCYLFGDEAEKEIFVIDPGGDYGKIKKIIDENCLKPKAIINTHGHGDHIGANNEFGVPVWIHRLDADFLTDPCRNLSGAFGLPFKTKIASRFLEDGDMLSIGRYNLKVLHTPGHTPGSICLKVENVVFTGDTLFCEGIGRTDFAYGSEEDIKQSIKEKLFILEDDCVIYPGHGHNSTIGHEKNCNPYL